ncbi:hypothetical protein ACFL6U_23890 [Planctomycetota bacterium]
MISLEGCKDGIANQHKDSDLENPQNSDMPKSMPCAHENVTELAQMVESCTALPDHIKQTIRTLLDPFMEDDTDE